MLDDTEKAPLTPKRKAEAQPVCTLMDDCSLRLIEPDARLNPLDLQRMLLSAAAHVTMQVMQHALLANRVLAGIQEKFDGFDEETVNAIRSVLGLQAPPPSS